MSTEAVTSTQIPHPLGIEFRSLVMTDERSASTRSAWFNPQPKKSIVPQLPPIALLILAVFLIAVIAATYGLLLVALFFYYQSVQKKNGAIPALRVDLMAEELDDARQRAQNQAMIDCGVNANEWREAIESGRVVSIMEAANPVFVNGYRYRLAPEVRIVTAGALDNGMVQHETTWIAERGPDPSNNAFVRSEDQQIPWRAVSRVKRTSERLTIETVGGSSSSVSLVTAQAREADLGVNLNDEAYITRFVPSFVEAAQKKVMAG